MASGSSTPCLLVAQLCAASHWACVCSLLHPPTHTPQAGRRRTTVTRDIHAQRGRGPGHQPGPAPRRLDHFPGWYQHHLHELRRCYLQQHRQWRGRCQASGERTRGEGTLSGCVLVTQGQAAAGWSWVCRGMQAGDAGGQLIGISMQQISCDHTNGHGSLWALPSVPTCPIHPTGPCQSCWATS